MCAKHHSRHSSSRSRRGHHRHARHQHRPPELVRISPERYERKLVRRIKVLAEQNARAGVYVPYHRVREAADLWMREGIRTQFRRNNDVDYSGGVPGGSSGNKPISSGPGSVGGSLVSSNTAPDRAMPRTIETDETLLKMNGRLKRLKDSLERKRLRWKQGITEFTLEEKRELQELERTVLELQAEVDRERLLDAGSEEAAERAQEIQQFALRNGLSWAEAKERLYSLSR